MFCFAGRWLFVPQNCHYICFWVKLIFQFKLWKTKCQCFSKLLLLLKHDLRNWFLVFFKKKKIIFILSNTHQCVRLIQRFWCSRKLWQLNVSMAPKYLKLTLRFCHKNKWSDYEVYGKILNYQLKLFSISLLL